MKSTDLPDDSDGYQMGTGTPASVASEPSKKTGIDPRTKMSHLLKDKEQEWTAVVEKKGPLRLLDLPMDVLKEIVKEVTSKVPGRFQPLLTSFRSTGHPHK